MAALTNAEFYETVTGRKLSGAAGVAPSLRVDLRIGDDGRLYAEALDNGPQHRRH